MPSQDLDVHPDLDPDLDLDDRGRLVVDKNYVELVGELARANRDRFERVEPSRILFVAGAARGGSLASIRPLTYGGIPPLSERMGFRKPRVTRDGIRIFYEICLRPRFFLEATAEMRLLTLAHELWHASASFDGTLAEDRRHRCADRSTTGVGGGVDAEHEAKAIVDAWRAATRGESEAARVLAYAGELRMLAWLSRPPSRISAGSELRAEYSERDLYSAIVVQRNG